MSINLSNLSDAAQKEYSKLIKNISYQKTVIEKCEVYTRECPSDLLKRARAGYNHNLKQLEEHDAIMEARFEKLRLEGEAIKAQKMKYLRDAQDKLDEIEKHKTRQQVSAEIELEKLNKQLQRIIDTVTPSDIQSSIHISPLTQSTEKSAYQQMLDDEAELEALRAGRSTEVSYALPQTSTQYGMVSDLSKMKKGVKQASSINKSIPAC